MIADTMRIADLWLKRDLALALTPPGVSSTWLAHKVLAECVCGRANASSRLNHVLAGDEPIRTKDELYYLAASLEYLVLNGAHKDFNRAVVDAFVKARGGTRLYHEPILGTFPEFAGHLADLAADRNDPGSPTRDDFLRLLSKQVHQALVDGLGAAAEAAGEVTVLHGPSRDWSLSPAGLERIIRQPRLQKPSVKEGDFIQLVVPPPAEPQIVFGFELRTDERVTHGPWEDIGGWFEPRYQPARTPIALLTEYESDGDNPRAVLPGDYWIQVIAVPHDGPPPRAPRLPEELRERITPPVAGWPRGYAEALAAIRHAQRHADKIVRLENRRQREEQALEPIAGEEIEIPRPLRLYRTEYEVVAPRAAHG